MAKRLRTIPADGTRGHYHMAAEISRRGAPRHRGKTAGRQAKIYAQILDPYIRLFADLKGQGPAQATKKITSYEYRKTAFDLSLFGSDQVVRAYNALMAHTYEAESTGKQEPTRMMRLWGGLLLEIRKSLGNKKTQLDELDMLRGMIKDLDASLGAAARTDTARPQPAPPGRAGGPQADQG